MFLADYRKEAKDYKKNEIIFYNSKFYKILEINEYPIINDIYQCKNIIILKVEEAESEKNKSCS